MPLLALALLALPTSSASALSTSLVVSQVYGGGGNAGASHANDFIEIFNRGPTSVTLDGFSVQYALGAGTTWSTTILPPLTIPQGGYLLVQEATGGGGGTALPSADATGSINLSITAGKVALVASTTPLSGTCPIPAAQIIDLVGYGTANCFEGSGAPASSNTTSDQRNGAGCTETDHNANDFTVLAPNPRNSATSVNPCQVPPDGDGDGVVDSFDNCPATANPAQTDTDGDGQGDACDADDDNDSVLDGADQCPTGAAAGTDTDGDGCKDAVEDPDDDNDTVLDTTDQCDLLDGGGTLSGCPSATGAVTLRYSKRAERFAGKFSSDESACVPGRELIIFKRTPGPDKKQGKATTTASGAFKLSRRASRGKYYVTSVTHVVPDVAECAGATSPILKVA